MTVSFLCPGTALADEDEAEISLSEETVVEQDFYTVSGSWQYTLIHKITLTNHSAQPAYNITVDVPLQDEAFPRYNQKIGEQFDPYPDCIYQDPQTGRRMARYTISAIAGNSAKELVLKYALQTDSASYYVNSATLAPLSAEDRMAFLPYLQPETGIESNDSEIASFVSQAVGSEENPYLQAKAIFAAVNLNLTYSAAQNSQSAKSVLKRGSGNCEGYTNLYIAALRNAGIPARKVNGYLHTPSLQNISDSQMGSGLNLTELGHAWVEFYVPDKGWVIADPTFTYSFNMGTTTQKFIDWSYFGNIASARRYIFLYYGSDDSQISYTATGGDLDIRFSASLLLGNDYLPFNDLKGHWAAAEATYCVEQGYFNGYSPSEFQPELPMSRAMFVAVLGRMYQAYGGTLTPYFSDLSQFEDVQVEKYYSEALGWALDEGLVEGYGNGRFGVDDPITREQITKIIRKFLLLMKQEGHIDDLLESADYAFTDNAAISPWAAEGVSFCVANGIMKGSNDGAFHPADSTTRAQVAAIIERIDKRLK